MLDKFVIHFVKLLSRILKRMFFKNHHKKVSQSISDLDSLTIQISCFPWMALCNCFVRYFESVDCSPCKCLLCGISCLLL